MPYRIVSESDNNCATLRKMLQIEIIINNKNRTEQNIKLTTQHTKFTPATTHPTYYLRRVSYCDKCHIFCVTFSDFGRHRYQGFLAECAPHLSHQFRKLTYQCVYPVISCSTQKQHTYHGLSRPVR